MYNIKKINVSVSKNSSLTLDEYMLGGGGSGVGMLKKFNRLTRYEIVIMIYKLFLLLLLYLCPEQSVRTDCNNNKQ